MLCLIGVFAVSVGVASAAVPSPYSKSSTASGTGSVATISTACPSPIPTEITRPTYSGTYTDYSSTTVTTRPVSTFTTTVPSHNVTVTVSSSGTNPSTAITYTTITVTSYRPTALRTIEICTSTVTKSLEYTTTVYTGTYLPSPVASHCPTSTITSPTYLGGTVYSTVTSTSNPPAAVTTTYTPAGPTTTTIFDTSLTATNTMTRVATVSSGLATSTYTVSCTRTTFTGTATSATSTQALRCAPTNLIHDVAYIQHINDSQSFAPNQPTVDASTCCQLCADNDLCGVSNFQGGICSLRVATGLDGEGTCGLAEVVELGYEGFRERVTQAGCGRVEYQDQGQ
ncbi:hypothetical protein B0A48_14592 [Cryoendolithus antarcticus]|uniref:Apple domain-containing protein n=1 Tax=Cryoendolithus antarcticus TaxID=1507870 RepID=A0A1V8SL06_9PEZI|nr:hypothetical protein B0A48_14592 [Cryoendolithus antarcticus]